MRDYCELFKLRYQQLRHKTPKEVCEMQKKQAKEFARVNTKEIRRKESGNREKKIHKEFLTKLEVQTTI